MASSFMRLGGVALRETGEQVLKRLSKESDHIGKAIGAQAEPFTKAIIKEMDEAPYKIPDWETWYRNDLGRVQQEGMDIPTAEKIMQMDNCADLRNLVDDLEKSGRAYKGRVPTHEYLVAEKRYDELCLSTLSRNPDDPGYYPPGFLEENKDDA